MTERSSWRDEVGALLELMAASGLAFAQPFFDLLGKNPDLFIGRRITSWQLVIVATLVVFGPPLILVSLEVVVGLASARARHALHWGFLAVAAAIIGVEAAKSSTDWGVAALVALGIAAGVIVVLLVARFQILRAWLRALCVAPIAFAGLFVLASPITPIVFASEGTAAKLAIAHPHRVVWVLFDELPESSLLDGRGAVDATLFPNFAALAAHSNWYRNSTTIAPFTLAAVPGMLTSSYPKDITGAATVANYPDNLFTLLGGTYDVNAVESLTAMCPSAVCHDLRHRVTRRNGLGGLVRDGLDLWGEFARPGRSAPGLNIARGVFALDPEPLATAESFVQSLAPSTRPRLDFYHGFLPHWPWRFVGPAAQDTLERSNPQGLEGKDRWGSEFAAASGRQRHLLQLQATDTILGQITTRLQSIGAWEDSLVVVTADHGVGFSNGDPPRGLSKADAADLVWTPLFVKLPGQHDGRIDDRPARTVDLLPTIADVLGVRLPWNPAGRSLLGTPRADGPVPVLHWWLDRLNPEDGRANLVDGPRGFSTVLTRRVVGPSDPPDDPSLALYRIGPYGGLVGRLGGPLIQSGSSPSHASITDPARFGAVAPAAKVAPWLRVNGTVTPASSGIPLAVTVNGVIGAVTQSVRGASDASAPWWASLPPQLFRPGSNDVRVYLVTGPPESPRLVPAS